MMNFGHHMGTGAWVFSIVATLIILGLIVATVVWLVSGRRDHGDTMNAPGETAREILNRSG